ncbi:MAG: metallophosphoesterase family protein [Planctomycetota bacterium]|nr:MAG: metallophosphoesterase family protein [Planctomycetota bacterium]
MFKRAFLSMCILLVLACALQAAGMRKGPYLYYPGVCTEMTVLWQLHAEPEPPAVCTLEWGLDPENLTDSNDTVEYGDDHQHKYTISGLVPGSKYYYQVTAGEDVYEGTFIAAPNDSEESLKFLAYGDTRTYPEDHNKVCAAMVAAFEADPNYQTFTLLSGDFVGSGTSEEDWDTEYFGGVGPDYMFTYDYEDPNYYWDTSYMLANLAINGCVGNHEALSQTLFPKYWPYPFVEGFYWSFEYGPALFVVIDQYRSTRLTDKGPKAHNQLRWLEDVLKHSDKEWKFLELHEPGYSAGGGHDDDVDIQRLVQPLCEDYGVDIVFGGHNHYYARCDVNDVQHLTLGGGGAPLREPEPDYSEYVVYCEMVHHFGKVAIDGNTLNFEAINANDGSVIDSFTITH